MYLFLRHYNFNRKCYYKVLEVIEKRLKATKGANCSLHRIRVYETPRNFIDYYGEK